jgi:hypothetical protein
MLTHQLHEPITHSAQETIIQFSSIQFNNSSSSSNNNNNNNTTAIKRYFTAVKEFCPVSAVFAFL